MNTIRLQTMLADFAQAGNGKITIVGGGWSVIGPEPTPSALAFVAKIPWTLANERHRLVVELVDEDHMPYLPPNVPDDFPPIRFEIPFEVGRPPGIAAGTDLDWAFAMNIGPLVLTPGKRYVWSVWLNDQTEEGWSLPFTVRPVASDGIRLVG